jgi:hypothetical protein
MILFKFLLAVIIVCSPRGQNFESSKVRFDGFYQTEPYLYNEHRGSLYKYLRFYPDGKVISVASEGTASDLKGWFKLNMINPSIGNYKIRGDKLCFSTTSSYGKVVCKGEIKDKQFIYLKWKSLINGRRGRETYFFVEVPNLD